MSVEVLCLLHALPVLWVRIRACHPNYHSLIHLRDLGRLGCRSAHHKTPARGGAQSRRASRKGSSPPRHGGGSGVTKVHPFNQSFSFCSSRNETKPVLSVC